MEIRVASGEIMERNAVEIKNMLDKWYEEWKPNMAVFSFETYVQLELARLEGKEWIRCPNYKIEY